MNNKEINLHSYDNVEKHCLYEYDKEELSLYLQNKLDSAKSDASFIKKNIFKDKCLNVCEIGSGNSKLLYLLEQQGILKKGIGYEISHSRWMLANKFKEILKCKNIENINKNFLEDKIIKNSFDLIIMVDIVLQIISPLYDNAEAETLNWVYESLNKGGVSFS